MMTKRWLFACFSVLLLTGMRNPFQPPEDHCRMAELSAWRYQGAVIQGGRSIGFIRDGQHKWRRVEQRDVLNNIWRVSQVTAQSVTIDTGSDCEPSQWQWQRQGEANEAVDSHRADDRNTQRAGREGTKHDAGGG
ncbi:HofP DNA utilization family protein [Citrobacter sp. R-1.5.2]|uniref:HofP DNA utilization family protein n=1 Tax=Citrobacter sp. R-1.5.2 TaxID=3046183 RepID=UPI002B24AF8F|nr:HofP DNA utilization family protein [Citrobacter sp. R-1.5.2]MEB2419204.1 HofP DNA utilization family protein [Citrobacter sp. R-1.5.2]